MFNKLQKKSGAAWDNTQFKDYFQIICSEINNLIVYLLERIDKEDEIVVVYDQNRVTNEVLSVLEQYKENIFSYPFNFQQNFL